LNKSVFKKLSHAVDLHFSDEEQKTLEYLTDVETERHYTWKAYDPGRKRMAEFIYDKKTKVVTSCI
jgi:hypothetical protein